MNSTQLVTVDYELGKNGWSNFVLTIDEASAKVGPFGYCSDALGDLVRMALMLATSADRAEASFDGEPTEWRVIADEPWQSKSLPPKFRIRVLMFNDSYLKVPEVHGVTLLEAFATADEVGKAIQKAAHSIWSAYGSDGYNQAWGGPKGFPLRALKALDAALDLEEPPPPT